MHIEQRGETQRLEALLRELRPIEARCLPISDECLRAIEFCRMLEQRPEGQHKDDTP
jgi:hypothetical protein